MTNTFARFTVVIVRAVRRDVIAGVSGGAPSGSGDKSETFATIVVGGAASRNSNAGAGSLAPGLSLGTNA